MREESREEARTEGQSSQTGDSLRLPLLGHVNGLRTVEGVSLQNKADSGGNSLFSRREPFHPPVFMDHGLAYPHLGPQSNFSDALALGVPVRSCLPFPGPSSQCPETFPLSPLPFPDRTNAFGLGFHYSRNPSLPGHYMVSIEFMEEGQSLFNYQDISLHISWY